MFWGELIFMAFMAFMTFQVKQYPTQLTQYLQDTLRYFTSKWSEVQGNAALLSARIVCNVDEDLRPSLDVDAVATGMVVEVKTNFGCFLFV